MFCCFMRLFLGVVVLYICTGNAIADSKEISYKSDSSIDFGSVTKQTGVDVTSTVSSTNSSSRGQLTIKDGSKTSQTINITFQSCGLTSDKVEVKDFTVSYGTQSWNVTGDGPFTQTGLTNPGSSGTKLQFGGTILVNKDAKTGSLTPCYNISIQYDCAASTPKCTTSNPVIASENANILVIGAPIVLNDIQQMSFGYITKPTTNSSIIMLPDGTMNLASGNAILVNGGSGAGGKFSIIAEKNVPISVYASPGSAVSGLRLNKMTASFNNGSVQNINNSNNSKTLTTSSSGTNTLDIGATLVMTANQVRSGSYSLSYDISIDYQ